MNDHEAALEPAVRSTYDARAQSASPGQATSPATQEPATTRSPGRTSRAQHRARGTWLTKNRANLSMAVGGVFLVLMLSTGGNTPGIFDRTTSPAESRAEMLTGDLPPIAAMGQSVRDGNLAFIVASVGQPSPATTQRVGLTQTAQGMFVIVRVDVANIGYEPRTLTATDQFLINDLGQRVATSAATTSLEGAEKILREKINPGSTVRNAPLLFDVPAGTGIAGIELHDSPSSVGVRVALR